MLINCIRHKHKLPYVTQSHPYNTLLPTLMYQQTFRERMNLKMKDLLKIKRKHGQLLNSRRVNSVFNKIYQKQQIITINLSNLSNNDIIHLKYI